MRKNKITDSYSQEIARYLCTQLFGTLNPAYLKCNDYDHHDSGCNCQEVYDKKLNSWDGTLEDYLKDKIFEFIETGGDKPIEEMPQMKGTLERLNKLTIL